ncbi:yellow-f isoform X1 [Nasonia vitripennis]|uniref:Bee-milk protein n=1 Tax=Nasonia vitripennis TaxID=7425 RepID=A0A7M6UFA6_NASVI|nr:yellow-f precursor [Nasonia vitripennis]XP_031784287.1 yellow-f isoform X1 [Nasonia vitripennis]
MQWIFVFAILTAVNCHPPEILYSWDKLDYNFPNESMRMAYIASGDFIQADNLPVGVSVWKDKMFITVPRWKKGVPANLNYIQMSTTTDKSPPLTPYPSWEANDVHSTSNDVIISIFRTRVDACDRLWGVDTGIDDILGDTKIVRPPRLIVIDLKTDQIIRSYTLKDSDQKADSFFGDLAVDVDKDSCDDAYAYLSDLGGYGLVVYSWAQNNSWRFHHNFFHFDPLNGDFNVTGINFHWTDGVFGMAVSPHREDGSKTLYFHALSAIREFSVPTSVLKNESYATADNYYLFTMVGEKGPNSQGTSSTIDAETGIIYFSQINRHGLACWNTKVPLHPGSFNLITRDPENLAFPNDLAIEPASRKLYTLMSNVPKLMYERLGENNKFIVFYQSLDTVGHHCQA